MTENDGNWALNALRHGDTEGFLQRIREDPACLRPDDGDSPLALAVEFDRADLVAACLELGADPNEPTDDCGWTLMRTAIESDKPDSLTIVRSLIAHGAQVDGIRDRMLYRIPVFDAARHGQLEKLIALLDAGADVNGRDPEDDETALMAAARFDYPEIAKLLLERGADASLMDSCIGQTALDLALEAEPHANEIVDMLRTQPNASSALDAAGGRLDVARVFLKGCFDADDMQQPLHVAASDGDREALETLLAAGYDIDGLEPECGDTPLIAATRLGEVEAVEFLLSKGADRSLTDDQGSTARELAGFCASDNPTPEDQKRYRRIRRLLR